MGAFCVGWGLTVYGMLWTFRQVGFGALRRGDLKEMLIRLQRAGKAEGAVRAKTVTRLGKRLGFAGIATALLALVARGIALG